MLRQGLQMDQSKEISINDKYKVIFLLIMKSSFFNYFLRISNANLFNINCILLNFKFIANLNFNDTYYYSFRIRNKCLSYKLEIVHLKDKDTLHLSLFFNMIIYVNPCQNFLYLRNFHFILKHQEHQYRFSLLKVKTTDAEFVKHHCVHYLNLNFIKAGFNQNQFLSNQTFTSHLQFCFIKTEDFRKDLYFHYFYCCYFH